MKTYRPYQPRQGFLLPPSPLDWLPEDHLACFILETVAQLDLSAITAYYERERRGYPPHDPHMMVALLLYAYCVGVPSSRKIEQRTHEDIAFRILAGNTHPDHTCISEFRRIHLDALGALFVQVLKLCERMGLVKLGVVALDGTKLKANASKHKAMSMERMKKEQERLEQKVRELLAAAEQADAQEDAQYGKSRRGDKLPEELRRAQSRLARIRATYAALLAEAAEQAAEKQESETEDAQTGAVLEEMARIHAAQDLPRTGDAPPDPDDDPPPPPRPGPLPGNRIPVDKDGTPKDSAQRNFTDPDSRIMKDKGGFTQGYNGQFVVDGEAQVVVAHGLGNQAPDAESFIPMIDRLLETCRERPDATLADAGYFSDANIRRAEARGAPVYIAPARTPHGQKEPPCDDESPPPGTLKELMQSKLLSPEGDALYRRRKTIVEPVFGQVKARGFSCLNLRGLWKARGEWALIALTHNLLKLHKAHRRRAVAPRPGRSTGLGLPSRAALPPPARPFLISRPAAATPAPPLAA
jgi:transposase